MSPLRPLGYIDQLTQLPTMKNWNKNGLITLIGILVYLSGMITFEQTPTLGVSLISMGLILSFATLRH